MAEKSKKPAEKEAKVPVRTGGETVPSTWEETWHPFMSLRRDMDRLFEDFVSRFAMAPFGRRGFEFEPFRPFESMFRPSIPTIDLVERDKEYVITAELAGMDEKDIDVKLSADRLTIRGERKEETEKERANYRLSERHYGSFERSFRLPEGVDQEKIGAKFTKGLLTIRLPKTEEAMKKEKKIPIEAQ
jgi:HSP20 family protein